MTQKEKELLLKDLCARLSYELKVQYKEKTYDLLGLDKGRIFVNIARIGEWLPTVYIFDIKPYLRPVSSMTEDEMFNFHENGGTLTYYFKYDIDLSSLTVSAIDWLNAHHFDYRGLIEKGLALEAPVDMYK